jgi:hypothetical protein
MARISVTARLEQQVSPGMRKMRQFEGDDYDDRTLLRNLGGAGACVIGWCD